MTFLHRVATIFVMELFHFESDPFPFSFKMPVPLGVQAPPDPLAHGLRDSNLPHSFCGKAWSRVFFLSSFFSIRYLAMSTQAMLSLFSTDREIFSTFEYGLILLPFSPLETGHGPFNAFFTSGFFFN